MGCPDGGCQGYELAGDLSFDENGDGEQNDTYNQDDSTWEWQFVDTNTTDTFIGSFEQPAGTPAAVWEFSGCNTDGNIAHGSGQDYFNNCDGLFQGEVVEELTSGNQYSSKVTVHRSNLPPFHFLSPENMSINWTVKLKHLGVIIFEHTYSPYLSFLLPADGEGEDCTDVTNQTGGKANSSYSIRTAPCDTDTYTSYSTNNLFRGEFEYNGYSITWE